MKKITLFFSLILVSALIIYGCSTEADSLDTKENNTPIISAISVNKSFKIQVNKGKQKKIYDTIKFGELRIYNDKGILYLKNLNTERSNNTTASKFYSNKWYIDCERYIGSNTEIDACDTSKHTQYDPIFVGSDYMTHGIPENDLYLWVPINGGQLLKGPMILDTNSEVSQKYMACWYENSPTDVVEPYTGQNVNKKKIKQLHK